jgi:hypothetical protein
MSSKVKELSLNGIIYNTNNENSRRIIGDYYEHKLLSFFINNNINVKYVSENNRFILYDFILEKDGIKYITELKSRLSNINNHTIELICYNKIQAYKKIINKSKTETKILFIFNHIEAQDNYKFYYYIVDIDKMDDLFFINYDCYDKPTYEIPIKYIKPIEELFN